MTHRKYEAACCQMAELVCSHGHEILHFLGWLCDYYSKHCLIGNTWLTGELAKGVREIAAMPKRKISHERAFQNDICKLTMLLSITPVKHHSKLCNPKYADQLSVIEPLLYQESTLRYKRNVEEAFGAILTSEMQRMFTVLYYLVKNNMRKEMVVLLNHLTAPGRQGVVQVPKRLPEGVKPALAGDMVWPLWHLLFEIPVNDPIKAHIEDMWYIFGFNYSLRARAGRLNILFMAYMSVMRPGALSQRELKDPIITLACAKIRVAFGDVLKIDFERKDRAEREKAEEEKRKMEERTLAKEARKAEKAKADAEGKDDPPPDNPYKYEYLKFFTYLPNSNDNDA